MFQERTLAVINQELSSGEEARTRGLEGRVRVCARRAAGTAVRAYLEEKALPVPGANFVDLLEVVQSLLEVPPEARHSAARLLERVNESYSLDSGNDLLAEARNLINILASLV